MKPRMGSLNRRPAFDPLELEIIDRVYNAAWAQILTRHPGRDIEKVKERQRALRRRLFMLADNGPVEFDTLRDRVLATMPETLRVTRVGEDLPLRIGNNDVRGWFCIDKPFQDETDARSDEVIFPELAEFGSPGLCSVWHNPCWRRDARHSLT